MSDAARASLTCCLAEMAGRPQPLFPEPQGHWHAPAVGIDVVDVSLLRSQALRTGPELLERIFTPRELAVCRGASEKYRWYCLAGRLAAKEATKKVLLSWRRGIGWHDMEICRDAGGRPAVLLRGRACEAARQAEFSRVQVSITHDAGLALALSMACREAGPTSRRQEWRSGMDVRDDVIGVMEQLGFDSSDLKEETSLHLDLGISSIELAEIAVAMEKHFEIRIDSGAEEGCGTFGDLLGCVQDLVSAKSEME